MDWAKWDKFVGEAIATPSGKLLVAAGYKVAHMGGGCTAWIKGDPLGVYVYLGDGDAGLGNALDIESDEWGASLGDHDGRYANSDAVGLKAVMDWCEKSLADPEPRFKAQQDSEFIA